MSSKPHLCAAIIAALLLPGASAQVITELTTLEQYEHSGKVVKVDCVATVNFWEASWRSLFVQSGTKAVCVKLPQAYYDNDDLNLQAGTRIQIKGEIDFHSCAINATAIDVLKAEEPVKPLEVSIEKTPLGQYWSRRVRFDAVAESAVITDEAACLVMRDGAKRFFIQRLGEYTEEEVLEWLGSRIAVTGTLSCFVNDQDRPVTLICHCMSDDSFEVQKQNVLPEIANGKDLIQNVSGQIGYLGPTGMVSVEQDDGTVTMVYSPLHRSLKAGDHVTVRVVAAPKLVDETKATPLYQGDMQGGGDEYCALVLQKTGTSSLPPPTRITARTIVTQEMKNKRVVMSGDVLSVVDIEQRTNKKRIMLSDQGRQFFMELKADQRAFNSVGLHLASRMTFKGAITKMAEGDSEFTVWVDDFDDIEVQESWGHFPKSTAIALVGGLICLIGGGLLVFWHLRSQVSHREQDLAQVIARLNSTYGAIREAILVIDDQGTVVGVNSRVKKILGLSPEHLESSSKGRGPLENVKRRLSSRFSNEESFEQLWDEVQSDRESVRSIELCTADDPVRTLIVYTAPVDMLAGYSGARIWTFDDITDRKRLEANLLQSQKMEAIGCLAGGVAHDFNNLLMAMTANLELARLDPEATIGESDEYLIAVEDSAHRAAKLIKHLLGFSRKASLDMKVVNPNDVVDGMRNLLQRTLNVGVTLKMNLLEDIDNVQADATQLEQVLLNICLNARDSFAGEQGTIEIETFNVVAADLPSDVPNKPRVAVENYVCVQICDNGSGMPLEVQKRIYDPFFTTKDPDKGTGLGLAMSFGIMEQHNGIIHCFSETGLGTRFQLFLPGVSEEVEHLVPISTLPVNAPEMGHVLLADDNAAVGQSTANALRAHGFNVTVVGDGKQAVDFVTENKGAAIVAILDLAMPVMSGTEAFTRIVAMDRELPVILYSGYVDEFSASFSDADALPFAILQKPFRMHELIELVSSAIADRHETTSRLSVG